MGALVGAFSVIVQPVVEPMDSFTALPIDCPRHGQRRVTSATLQPTNHLLGEINIWFKSPLCRQMPYI